MSNPDHEFTYNMKAVAQETGLKPDTLRAWERRYGLPNPQRTTGGHRLYSQRDIDTLKWLVARQQEGLSISRAIDLWQKLESEDNDPISNNPLEFAGLAKPEQTLTELRETWISACLAFGELGAEQVMTDALALYPVETICIELLQAGLAEIGQRWHEGKVSAQQEHFASNYALKKLEALMTDCPNPTRPGKILIGTPSDEEHTFSSLLLTLLLCRQGWNTVYLGHAWRLQPQQ